VAQKGERLHISHSIVDHVLHQRQGVICTDTLTDSRFSAAPSVMQLGIREAICVPLQGRHSILGAIYADHRSVQELGPEASNTPARRFSQDHLALMVSIGHQAGLAVENSSLYQAKLDSERLAAIGQTIAIVSHHVKNVLQGLKGGSALIRSGLETGDLSLARRGDTILERNLDRVYDLVLDMLSYSKNREPVRSPVQIRNLIDDLIDLMRPRAESQHIRIERSDIPESLVVSLDEEGMHRAILNLITNAMDAVAGRENGVVQISATYDTVKDFLLVQVADNGAGIAPEDMGHLFELFESTKGSKGTGLGLPVSDKIIREHGGRIRVESQPGEGARFIIEIPGLRAAEPEIPARTSTEATMTESEILRARSAMLTERYPNE
jgi:signal transduction histidine kinase